MFQLFSQKAILSPTVEWKTPLKENPDTTKKESVNLAEHYEDDVSPPKKEEASSKIMERLSISYQKAALMQNAMDASAKKIEYTKKTPDTTSIRLGTFTERDIVDWFNQWADAIAEDPQYPFSFAGSISRHIKMKMIVANDIEGGLQEVNAAGMPELWKWLCACIRPIDNISFINSLDRNVFFRSKSDFVLTERNHRDFFENIKTYNRDFCCLLDLLMDSLLDTQERPPLTAKDGEGILSVYLQKIPYGYGYAVWRDMPGEKKYKKFSEFLKEFMPVCWKHVEKKYAPVKNTDDSVSEVCPLLEEPVALHIMCTIKEESDVISLTADVVVNGISTEFNSGTVDTSDSFVDVAVPGPTVSIIVPVLEQDIASIMLPYGSSLVSYNFHVVKGKASLRRIALFSLLMDAVCGSVMLFEGWSISMLSEGFPPGPPKKPPPWFPYIKILVIFGTSNLWLY
jgi:hypothetical protein